MKKSVQIDSSKTNDGKTISLHSHNKDYFIRVDGQGLMSTRQNHSEKVLAEVICQKYSGQNIHILVGGLGFGGTTKAVLDNISKNSTVLTVELMPSIIKWNKDLSPQLNNEFLSDSRSTIQEDDVGKIIQQKTREFDAIILDVDNGPEAFSTESNNHLYTRPGLLAIKAALKPRGTLGIWSASPSKPFEKLMEKSGFTVETIKAKSRPEKGSTHTLLIGSLR